MAQASVSGEAFAPGQARGVPARLERQADTVRVLGEDGTPLLIASAASARLSAPLGATARRVEFPDGGLFVSHDAKGLEAALPPRSLWQRGAAWLHGAEAFHPRLIGVAVLAMVGMFALYRLALPAVVSGAVAATPDSLKRAADTSAMLTADKTLFDDTRLDAEVREGIAADFRALVAALPEADRKGADFDLLFRDAPLVGPNAMALPGGTIVITDQLVEEFDDRDLFAGVLAHEIAHVTEEHGLHRVYRSLGFFLMVSFVAGDVGPVLEEALLEGGLLLSLSNSRAQETEADGLGVDLLIEAGFEPEGMARFFDWAAEEAPDLGWLSTHPGSADRAAAIRERALATDPR